ncbi:hypothetical protein T439DRAFT_303990 [Meredithblackwellia eburnea MCA 4105]
MQVEVSPDVLESKINKLDQVIEGLGSSISDGAAKQLRNLARFQSDTPSAIFPRKKLAGVLILLHLDSRGELQVVLTTRSSRLRSHPGETALPGGRMEDVDDVVEATALREANEEIGLPLTPPESLLYITTLPPYSSRTLLVVVPAVYLLTSPSAAQVISSLRPNPDEVEAIFHVPLQTLLQLPSSAPSAPSSSSLPPPPTSSSPKRRATRSSAEAGKVDFDNFGLTHTYEDLIWLSDRLYRLHHFTHSSFTSPIWGLTADILITAALIAEWGLSAEEELVESGEVEQEDEGRKRRLGYGRWAEGQMTWKEIIEEALRSTGQKGLQDRRTKET